jgi:hypothetical protein
MTPRKWRQSRLDPDLVLLLAALGLLTLLSLTLAAYFEWAD